MQMEVDTFLIQTAPSSTTLAEVGKGESGTNLPTEWDITWTRKNSLCQSKANTIQKHKMSRITIPMTLLPSTRMQVSSHPSNNPDFSVCTDWLSWLALPYQDPGEIEAGQGQGRTKPEKISPENANEVFKNTNQNVDQITRHDACEVDDQDANQEAREDTDEVTNEDPVEDLYETDTSKEGKGKRGAYPPASASAATPNECNSGSPPFSQRWKGDYIPLPLKSRQERENCQTGEEDCSYPPSSSWLDVIDYASS